MKTINHEKTDVKDRGSRILDIDPCAGLNNFCSGGSGLRKEIAMFCFQCQETAKNTGCTVRGVCGKPEETAHLQDLLIFALKKSREIFPRRR
jgi:hypothetical protein